MTDTTASVVDESTFSVRRTVHVAASVDKVWATITQPDLISQWFGRAEFVGSGVGATGTLTWDDHGSIPFRIEAIDEPRSISYRWSNDHPSKVVPELVEDENSTVFTFTLEGADGGVDLTVVETGFETGSDPIANLEDHRGGWDFELDELLALFA